MSSNTGFSSDDSDFEDKNTRRRKNKVKSEKKPEIVQDTGNNVISSVLLGIE